MTRRVLLYAEYEAWLSAEASEVQRRSAARGLTTHERSGKYSVNNSVLEGHVV